MANKVISGCGFHHIGLKVKDYEKSIAMYRALGFEEIVGWGEGDHEIRMFDLGDGGRLELFAGGGDFLSETGKWLHFAMKADDVEAAYNKAIEVGFKPKTAPKLVALDSRPEKISIMCAFVVGNDGEELEFFKQV
ncbi:MAG: VOC family protein [Clostridia bacterium]|nr:VOC family protein [Clostridia bacterium]